jgi:hypothetical protein
MQYDSFEFDMEEDDEPTSIRLPADDPYAVKILDWFVLNGYNTFERDDEDSDPWMVNESNKRFTGINKPLCDLCDHPIVHVDDTYSYQLDHLVEVSTLTSLFCSWPLELMDQLIAPLQEELERTESECDYEIETCGNEEGRAVWVVSRFNENDLAESNLDLKMREHYLLVDRVDALLS